MTTIPEEPLPVEINPLKIDLGNVKGIDPRIQEWIKQVMTKAHENF